MTSTGYNVMGWQVDGITGQIRKDAVSPLRIMQEKNLTSDAEATQNATCAGVVDKNSPELDSEGGYAMNLNFYDDLGYLYTAKFSLKAVDKDTGSYTVELGAIYDSEENNILQKYLANGGDLTALFGANASGGVTNTPTPYTAINTEFTDTGVSNTLNGNVYHHFSNSDGKVYAVNTTQDAATGRYDQEGI